MMNKYLLLFPVLFLLQCFHAEAQRRGATTYPSLLVRTDQPASYIDHFTAPAGDAQEAVTISFRLDYDFIPFLKIRPDMQQPSPEAEYYAPVRMGVEIFEGEAPRSRRAQSNAVSVFRDSWQDTIWVDSYEITESRFDYAQGFVSANLAPGTYHYELQLSRAGSVREMPSIRRTFHVPAPVDTSSAAFTLMQTAERPSGEFSGTLLNYGSHVLYGQDYSLLIRLPQQASETESYRVRISQLAAGEDDGGTEVLAAGLGEEHYIRLGNVQTQAGSAGELQIRSNVSAEGSLYAIVPVPNSGYENARFLIQLFEGDSDKPRGRKIVNSQWLDMPVSLYNLDVAIDMLRFILPDDELRRISSGSATEKEQKFRQFWKERDPSPDTEFNELMAEYYRRIDYSFKNFSSLQVPGYDTDQGKAYILYGPPNNIERRLPANAPTREIWQYAGRTLIFEATTGFGDFKLISES